MSESKTTAAVLIDSLQPHQRALLFTALQFFLVANEEQLEQILAKSEMPYPLASMVKKGYEWNIAELNALRKKIFAECFPDDLILEPFVYAAIAGK